MSELDISAQGIARVVAVLMAAIWLTRRILDTLNLSSIKKHQGKIPAELQKLGFQDEEKAEKSAQYSAEKLRFGQFADSWDTLISAALLFSGMLGWADGILQRLFTEKPLTASVAFMVLLFLFSHALEFPFRVYQTFHLEGKWGFNKSTWGLFIADELKGLILGAVIGIPLLYAFFAFIKYTGDAWWIWALLFIGGFQILLMLVYPFWIAPLFNKFDPLPDGELKTKLMELAEKTDFPVQDIMVMDGSRRSGHSNAYFTGMGKFRRIVLYDTLVEQLSVDELCGVLAHEIGHNKKKHTVFLLLLNLLLMGLGLWLMSLLLTWEPLFAAFGMQPSAHGALFLVTTLSGMVGFVLSPLPHILSRTFEYQADAYAATHTGTKDLSTALISLTRENLSNLFPHPIYSFFYYSHPTVPERIRAMENASKSG